MKLLLVLAFGIAPLYSQSNITITSSATSSIIHPGETILIRVAIPVGWQNNGILIAAPGLQGFIAVPPVFPYEVSVPIPSNAPAKKYRLKAFTSISGGSLIESNTLSITVERPIRPTSIKIEPSRILELSVGAHFPLQVSAIYPDGTTADITDSTLTTYSTRNVAIATVQDGILQAVAPGATDLVITNAGVKALLVPVSVLALLTVKPDTARLYASEMEDFHAYPTVKKLAPFIWSVSPGGFGTVDQTGRFTASQSIASIHEVTVTAASVNDPGKRGSAIVTLFPPIAIRIGPEEVSLGPSEAQKFEAKVQNDRYFNPKYSPVQWTIHPERGSVDGTGLYTAPAVIDAAQTVTITAICQSDHSKSASAAIHLRKPK